MPQLIFNPNPDAVPGISCHKPDAPAPETSSGSKPLSMIGSSANSDGMSRVLVSECKVNVTSGVVQPDLQVTRVFFEPLYLLLYSRLIWVSVQRNSICKYDHASERPVSVCDN